MFGRIPVQWGPMSGGGGLCTVRFHVFGEGNGPSWGIPVQWGSMSLGRGMGPRGGSLYSEVPCLRGGEWALVGDPVQWGSMSSGRGMGPRGGSLYSEVPCLRGGEWALVGDPCTVRFHVFGEGNGPSWGILYSEVPSPGRGGGGSLYVEVTWYPPCWQIDTAENVTFPEH